MDIIGIKPCRDDKGRFCRDWTDCQGKPWYPIADICYCRYQVIWLIQEFIVYQAGQLEIGRDTWPAEDKESGYIDSAGVKRSPSRHAPYERVMEIVGDVHERLSRTGSDGRFLVLEVQKGCDYKALSQEARDALNYINGWRRKKMSYSRWKADRKYQKTIKISSK